MLLNHPAMHGRMDESIQFLNMETVKIGYCKWSVCRLESFVYMNQELRKSKLFAHSLHHIQNLRRSNIYIYLNQINYSDENSY